MARTTVDRRRNENTDGTITEVIGRVMMTNDDVQDTGREGIMKIETEIEAETEIETSIAAIAAGTDRDHTVPPDLGLAARLHEDHDGLHHPIDDGARIHPGHAIDPHLDLGRLTARGMTAVIQRDTPDIHLQPNQDTIGSRISIEPLHGRSVRKMTMLPLS